MILFLLADLPPKIKAYLFTDWIVNEKSFNPDQINRNVVNINDNVFTNLLYICRPRTAQGNDCLLLKNSNLADVLEQLDSDKFQLMLQVSVQNVENFKPAEARIVTNISIWNACKVNTYECQAGSVCKSGASANDFKCVEKGQENCPKNFKGKFCQIDEKAVCEDSKNYVCVLNCIFLYLSHFLFIIF